MTHSATRREAKRSETASRILRCAQRLTIDRGLDGWTMEDLAARSDVSRRTLFNYCGSKTDAVLGPPPEVPEEALATFVAGGPTGSLIEDVVRLADALFDEKDLDPEIIELTRELIRSDVKLMAVQQERFEDVAGELAQYVLDREGAGFGADRARLLVRLLVSIFEVTLSQLIEGSDQPFDELFGHNIEHARQLLT